MRRLSLIFIGFLLISTVGSAQVRFGSEIGIGVGTFNYSGDMARMYRLSNSKMGGQVIYRYARSQVVNFRSSLTFGKVGAKETPIDPLAVKRNASFNVTLMELAVGMEFHFLNWRDNIRLDRFSPYIHAGVGLFGISGHKEKKENFSNVQLSIPFGVGLKYLLQPRLYLALEFGVRKTFFDYLDNVSDGDVIYKNYQYGNPYDNDTYYFSCLSITYTFYDIPCPTSPYRKRGAMSTR